MVCDVVCVFLLSLSVRAGGVLFKTRTQYQGVFWLHFQDLGRRQMLEVSVDELHVHPQAIGAPRGEGKLYVVNASIWRRV